MTDLTNPTLLIAALSVATERLTEIIKGIFFPNLLTAIVNDVKNEARRQAKIQTLAVFSGIAVSGLAFPITSNYFENFFDPMPKSLLHILMVLALGLVASGGAGAWNSILGYVLKLKNS